MVAALAGFVRLWERRTIRLPKFICEWKVRGGSLRNNLKPMPGSAANGFDPAFWVARVVTGSQGHGTQLIPPLHNPLVLHELGIFASC